MAEMYFEDHPTDPNKVIIRKPYPVKFFDPPQREWVGLTDKDLQEMKVCGSISYKWVKAAEAKLKEKNHG